MEDRVKELGDQAKALAENAESGTKYTTFYLLAEAQLELNKFDEALESLNRIPEDKRGNSRYNVALARAHKGKVTLLRQKRSAAIISSHLN